MSPGPRTVTGTWSALSKHLVNERMIRWFLPCQQKLITTSLGDDHNEQLAFTDGPAMVTQGYHLPFMRMISFSSSATCDVGVGRRHSVMSNSFVQLFVAPWTVARQAPLPVGMLQARILQWVAMTPTRGFSQPRSPELAGRFFTDWATREAPWCTCYSPHLTD